MNQKKIGVNLKMLIVNIGNPIVMGELKMEETPRERLESKAELLNAIRNWLWQERITPEELQELIQQVKENPIPF